MLGRLFDGLSALIFGLIRICIRLFTFQFLPAVFIVSVWLTEQALLLLPNQAAKLRPGMVVILATLAWTAVGSGLWLILAGWWMGLATLQWAALVSGLWGLAAGGTLARDWNPPAVLQPPSRPDQSMGIHPHMTVDEPEDQTISIDDLLTGGLFVGPDVRHTNRKDD